MAKRICFIYTDTNGLHQFNKNVEKKYIFGFARMVAIHYSIGTYIDGKYKEEKRVDSIIKPECFTFNTDAVAIHGIEQKVAKKQGIDIYSVMSDLKNNLSNVDVIVSHNLPFHLRTIQVECFRTCTTIVFNKFICIDTISYNHNMDFPKLNKLKKELNVSATNHLDSIIQIFLKLYLKTD